MIKVFGGIAVLGVLWLAYMHSIRQKEVAVKEQQDRDIMELGLLLSGECLQCPLDEVFLVGSSVMTRLKDSRYPKTVIEVIAEDGQYHGYNAEQYCFSQVHRDIAKWLVCGYRKPENVLFFWRNNQSKPSYVKEITHRMKYHNFGI